jgi:hypothetical protein
MAVSEIDRETPFTINILIQARELLYFNFQLLESFIEPKLSLTKLGEILWGKEYFYPPPNPLKIAVE